MITRRGFILAAGGLVCSPIAETMADPGWHAPCRAWMNVFIPNDESGNGADDAAIWARIERIMAADPARADWMRVMFQYLAAAPLPATEGDIRKALQDVELGPFLRFFQDFLIESYYGSDLGWHDLGIRNPPQPKGFMVAE